MIGGLESTFEWIANRFPAESWLAYPYAVRALFAIVLLGLSCGMVGSLVVGNRMAFLSDALAHCAFAGVTLGMILSYVGNLAAQQFWVVPAVMVSFGVCMGLAIAFVRDKTTLASDTIIGVFFAFAVGLGVMLIKALRQNSYLSPESFLFGSILAIDERDLLLLFALTIATAITIYMNYNSILFSSFSQSLARSRGIRVRLSNYILVVLLALIVNICLKAVGALLINALLVVPAAAAANLAGGTRSMFWWTLTITLVSGISGLYMSHAVAFQFGGNQSIDLVPSGAIVLLCVACFFVTLGIRVAAERRRPVLPV